MYWKVCGVYRARSIWIRGKQYRNFCGFKTLAINVAEATIQYITVAHDTVRCTQGSNPTGPLHKSI